MSQEEVLNNGQQSITNTDLSKIFVFNNRYETMSFTNDDVYDDVQLQAGMVMGRIASTNKVVQLVKGASDGSQYPIGVLLNDLLVQEGDTVNVSVCVSGDVAEEKLIFLSGTALTDVVESKTIRDRIGSDTVGIKLVAATELTGYDNQ